MKLYTMAKVQAAPVRRITENSIDYAVMPCVVIAVDEMNGEIVPNVEVKKSTDAWEGTAVTLGHPTVMGIQVSVKDAPHFQIGTVRYPSYVDNQLRVELWIPVGQGHEVDIIVNRMEQGEVFEVSSGYFAATERNESDVNVQFDIEPDHVAILVNQVGACSVADGCGAPRTNSCNCPKCQGDMTVEDTTNQVEDQEVEDVGGIQAGGTVVNITNSVPGTSAGDDGGAAAMMVNSTSTGGSAGMSYIPSIVTTGGWQMTTNDDDEVDLPEDGGDDESAAADLPEGIAELADLIQEMGGAAAFRDALTTVKANSDNQREALVTRITTNSSVWTADDLTDMPLDTLQKLAATVQPADYSGANAFPVANSSEWQVWPEATETVEK